MGVRAQAAPSASGSTKDRQVLRFKVRRNARPGTVRASPLSDWFALRVVF